MEKFGNNSQHAFMFYTVSLETPTNASNFKLNFAKSSILYSPLFISVAILLIFLFSSTIILGNSLVLISMYRFKRLRTPSNYLVISLATSDLGIGIFIPVGMYLELCGVNQYTSAPVCLFNYAIPITLSCVSVLVMLAIAVDRFTSLAKPLTYNNLITHSAVERYILVFWIYSSFVGFSPLIYYLFHQDEFKTIVTHHCSFGNVVARPIQLFMFCAVYGPSACILSICYGYIYIIARGHARAILECRHSLHYGSTQPRYGLALAITAGLFFSLWLPFQVCMLLDVFLGSKILTDRVVIFLSLPIFLSSAFNPWIYGYRNSEVRLAVHKVVDDIVTLLGFSYRSQPIIHAVPPSVAATAGDPASYANAQKDLCPWEVDEDLNLVPIAKPESSGFLSDSDNRISKEIAKKVLGKPNLKGSKSMVETFAVHNGTDVWVFMGRSVSARNGDATNV